MTAQKPVRIAIIGGGCAAMTAAFELTRPQLQGKYAVTVYQLGWRLGGKGASGRGPAGRIEEHGLHLWMGFYENAFRIMRECYAELGRDPKQCPIADWRDAFEPAPLAGVCDRLPNGEWEIWQGTLPPTEGLPGDPLPASHHWTVAEYVARSVALIRGLLETIRRNESEGNGESVASALFSSPTPDNLVDQVTRLFEYTELATLAGLIQGVATLETMVGSLAQFPQNLLLRFLDVLAQNARTVFDQRLVERKALRRVWNVVDLTLATLRGIVRFGILTDPRGFDAIDEYDSREWLLLCGASPAAVDSGWVRALYDLGFSYEDGEASLPRVAAGQALRGTLRAFFTYRGSFFWRMRAGMGDAVFAPLYEVLKRRGVRFEFFHRLRNVGLGSVDANGAQPHVATLEFEVQARTKSGGEYAPLVDYDGLPSWPSQPLYEQLENEAELRRRHLESHSDSGGERKILRVQSEFDLVVLGIGVAAVPHVCGEILARDARWRAMVDHVKTVATQAFQLWLRDDMSALGWPGEPINVAGFVEPFDTWADMRHLIALEKWPGTDRPRSLAYFCNVLAESDAGSAGFLRDGARHARDAVRRNAVRFLNEDIVHLWPNATRSAGRFRWDLLVDPGGSPGDDAADESRFASQYWTANVNPSDRYALSLPGTIKYRISPLDETFDNLTIAGDWTACGFNAGCVEAAVMSGRLAAHAIAQSPPLEDIVGYDHP